MYKITATAPTTYQFSSLQKFGMPIQKRFNGSFDSEMIFDSKKEAKLYLMKRANLHIEYDKLNESYWDIENGFLEIDAVTAHIEEVEEETEN